MIVVRGPSKWLPISWDSEIKIPSFPEVMKHIQEESYNAASLKFNGAQCWAYPVILSKSLTGT